MGEGPGGGGEGPLGAKDGAAVAVGAWGVAAGGGAGSGAVLGSGCCTSACVGVLQRGTAWGWALGWWWSGWCSRAPRLWRRGTGASRRRRRRRSRGRPCDQQGVWMRRFLGKRLLVADVWSQREGLGAGVGGCNCGGGRGRAACRRGPAGWPACGKQPPWQGTGTVERCPGSPRI